MTPEQREALELQEQGLTQNQIAQKLGISRRSVRNRLDGAKRRLHADPAIAASMRVAGTELVPSMVWAKVKDEDGTRYSVQLRPKPQDPVAFLDEVHEAFKDLPPAPALPGPTAVQGDLLTTYPLFDVHLGLRAEAGVSGEEVDIRRAKERMLIAMAQLVASAPASKRAVVINGGDFTHADDDENATPAHKHVLDVACRNYTTVTEGVELIAALIEMALQKHEIVDYISVPGNHDPKNWVTIMIGLYYRYRENPRVNIELTPKEFSVYEFGSTLIAVHHGHKRKAGDLVAFFAAEFAPVWGRTKQRYLLTGHHHSLESKRYPGMYWERFEPITPRDHYAASSGYDQAASMSCVTYSREGGEVARAKVAL